MLLAIDCGNTNTVYSIWDGSSFIATWRQSTDPSRTADQYFVWLSTLMEYAGIDVKIERVIISAVVPRVVFNLRVLSDRYFSTRPVVVGRQECVLPVPPRVDTGTAVGPDRLANTVGAHRHFGPNSIVVDFGTATNFDVVDHDGAYVGGVIAPGVNLSLNAMHRAAAALPNVDVTEPDHVVGKNTVHCMQSGIYWGHVGLIREITRQIQAERNEKMTIVATGGLAPLFDRQDDLFDHYDQDLTMRGLVVIADHNS